MDRVLPHHVLRPVAAALDVPGGFRWTPAHAFLLLRLDGLRSVADVCAMGQSEVLDALRMLQELVEAGVVEGVQAPMQAVPRPAPGWKNARTPLEEEEFRVWSLVDGETPVRSLAEDTGLDPGRVTAILRGLAEKGLVQGEGWTAALGGATEREAGPAGGAGTAQEAVIRALAADLLFLDALWSLVPVINPESDLSAIRLEALEGYPLALIDGRHTVEEVCRLSAREPEDMVRFLLRLFAVGIINFGPPPTRTTGRGMVAPAGTAGATAQQANDEARRAASSAPSSPAASPEGGELDLTWEDVGMTPLAAPPPRPPAPSTPAASLTGGPAAAPGPPSRDRPSDTPPPGASRTETPPGLADLSSPGLPALDDLDPLGLTPPPTGPHVPPAQPVETGRIEGTGAVAVLTDRIRSGFSGLLLLRSRGVVRSVVFEGGVPVLVDSTAPNEDLAFFLFRSGVLDAEGYGHLEAERRSGSGGVEGALERLGLLGNPSVLDGLNRHAIYVLLAMGRVLEGTFEARPGQGLPPRGAIRRKIPLQEVFPGVVPPSLGDSGILGQSRFGGGTDVAAEVLDRFTEVNLDFLVVADGPIPESMAGRERALLDLIRERPRPLREVLALSTMSGSRTRRFVFNLYRETLIRFESPPLPYTVDDDPEELADTLERLNGAHLFARLGIHPIATGEEVEAAYGGLAALYNPDRFVAREPEVRTLVAAIRQRLDEARRVLGNDDSRRDYRLRLMGPDLVKLFAKAQFRRALAAFHQRRDTRAAGRRLAYARDLYPDEPAYMAYLGAVRAVEDPGDSMARALVQRARAIGPDSAWVLAAAAIHARATGDPAAAADLAARSRARAAGDRAIDLCLRAEGL